VARYLGRAPERTRKIPDGEIWKSFRRDWAKEALLEKTLQESENDYRSLFELSPDAVVVWNSDAIIHEANKSAATLLGYDGAEDLIGKSWLDFVAPEDRQARAERIRSLEKAGGISESEFRMLRKDGSYRFVQGRVVVELDSAGHFTRAIAAARDITDRKAAEEAVYLSEARFRSAFEAAGHGMALVALDGRFLKVNAAYCQITGYSEDEMLARAFQDITYPEDLAESVKNFLRLRNREISTYQIEKRFVRKDGGVVWGQANVSVVCDAARAPIYYVSQVQDITARKAAEAALRAQALHDPLTGLPNRPAFLERLKEAFASSRRGAEVFAVLYLDLDRFKDVNDTLGHAEGDRLLQAVAARLKSDVRESDFTARFGGDEFAVLQTGLNDPSDAGALAAKLTKSMAAPYQMAAPFQIERNEMLITVSIGISFYDPGIANPEAMLTQADLALYRAKDEGRDRFCFHSAELDREVRERVALTNELRAALCNDELELYYQPQVELASGRIVGLEALTRWNHPQRGLLMPDAFIHIAERTGSICALGHWVLDHACRQIKAWRDQGIAPPLLAINVSAAEMHGYSEFEQFLADSFKRWSIAPGDIELELTESVLMETTQMHSDALARIKELGASIAIDDFGTGYSSLAYLSAYPVSRIKIAQRFMLGIPDNAGDVAITNATLSLARELGIKVIAEGVQTKAQLDFLVSAGCAVGQGFYFSKAVQAGRAAEFLRRGFIEPAVNGGETMRQTAPG
jgi:diguanylate cyclase (GGDEF)-like protein/PAS domain S-box-containing protein